jgi:hypothetical protein
MAGFGTESFGNFPFGQTNWGKIVLWDELPEEMRNQDLEAGGWYYKFVTALVPSFNEMLNLISRSHENLIDPATVRMDLLKYVADKFGVILDYSEPDVYQRTRVEIAGRWRLIKGKKESYEILCAVHGFNVSVKEIFWNGEGYTTVGPKVSNEQIGVIS